MINKHRYSIARDRSNKMIDKDDTIDKVLTDRFIEIILEQKKTFKNVLVIGDRNDYTFQKLNQIGLNNVSQINISNKKNYSKDLYLLPYNEQIEDLDTYDLIINLSLVNFLIDIPGFLKQLKNLLSKDGLLLINFFSENNIVELKELFSSVELGIHNGISQRFMPIVDIREIGDLINNIGFSDTVISREYLNYLYSSFNEMISHLRLMVCTNFLDIKNNKFINKYFMNKLIIFFEKNKVNNKFKLGFDILIISSWKK